MIDRVGSDSFDGIMSIVQSNLGTRSSSVPMEVAHLCQISAWMKLQAEVVVEE